jgi:TPR repeat protein
MRFCSFVVFSIFLNVATISCSKREPKGVDKTESNIQSHYRNCELGDSSDCYELSILLINTEDKNAVIEGTQLLQRLCTHQVITGCSGLGSLAATGTGIERNEAMARSLFERACHDGDSEACFNASDLWLNAEEMPTSLSRSFRLSVKSCLRLFVGGCAVASEIALYHWAYKNIQKMVHVSLCKLGNPRGCFNAGRHYEMEKHNTSDLAQARSFYERACSQKSDSGCVNLGVLLLKGQGGNQDLEKARTLFEDTCDRQDTIACYNLAIMLKNGTGGIKDTVKSNELLRKLCDAGHQDACKHKQDIP